MFFLALSNPQAVIVAEMNSVARTHTHTQLMSFGFLRLIFNARTNIIEYHITKEPINSLNPLIPITKQNLLIDEMDCGTMQQTLTNITIIPKSQLK